MATTAKAREDREAIKKAVNRALDKMVEESTVHRFQLYTSEERAPDWSKWDLSSAEPLPERSTGWWTFKVEGLFYIPVDDEG